MTCDLSFSSPNLRQEDYEEADEEVIQLIDDGEGFRWDVSPKTNKFSLNMPDIQQRPNSAPAVDTPNEAGDSEFSFDLIDTEVVMTDLVKQSDENSNDVTQTKNSPNHHYNPDIDQEIDSQQSIQELFKPEDDKEMGTKNISNMDRNVLNLAQIQCVQLTRTMPYRPVIPVISEDSCEDQNSSQEEFDKKRSLNHQKSKLDSDIPKNQRNRYHKQEMKSTKKYSVISTDESSLSSDEERVPDFMPGFNNRRRHSIATTSVDHVAQVLALLKKTHSNEDCLNTVQPSLIPLIPNLQDCSVKGDDKLSSSSSLDSKEAISGEGENTELRQESKNDPENPRRRFSLADVSSIYQSVQEPSFAREILHHQLVQLASSQDSINEDIPYQRDSKFSKPSLAPPASYLRTRRLSLGNVTSPRNEYSMKAIHQNINLPHSSDSNIELNVKQPEKSVGSNLIQNFSSLEHQENKSAFTIAGSRRLKKEVQNETLIPQHINSSARFQRRRSSWACVGTHAATPNVCATTLLRESQLYGENKDDERSDVKDPYVLTLHFITDPKQSKVLKSLLRPITHSVAAKLKLFNYVERSEAIVKETSEPEQDPVMIPALAIMVFLHEDHGLERILKAQQYLREAPWKLHHQIQVGGNVLLYPTNNQDFFCHHDDMPLWAVRQVHLGKDRLRFMIFVSHANWNDSVEFYSKILSRQVEFRKEDFCYFLVFSCWKLNLEVQLALKKLPASISPRPLDDAILQFKVQDMGGLVPLLPCVCTPISDKRWQTTDLDGNKVLLFRQSEPNGKRDEHESISSCSSPTDSEPSIVSSVDQSPSQLIYDAFSHSDAACAV